MTCARVSYAEKLSKKLRRSPKGITLTFLVVLLLVMVSSETAALRNPSAVYCRALGYQFTVADEEGGQRGYCQLPDGTRVDAWAFLKGQVAQEHSYCRQQGHDIKTVQDSQTCEGIYTPDCAVCILADGTEVEVTKLMNLSFAESSCGDGHCSLGVENYENCPADCPSGELDGYCDGVQDGKIDPDCAELGETDPDQDGVPTNKAPTADAGSDQTVSAGAPVTLDCSGSSDPEGSSITYQWRQTEGTPVTLSDVTAMQPTFTAPQVSAEETLTFELTVTDDQGLTATDTVNIVIKSTSLMSIGGCAAGSNVTETVDTASVNEFSLLLCRQPPDTVEGRLYVSIEVPSLLQGLVFFRPGEDQVPLANGSYVMLVGDGSGFFSGAADFYYSQGLLSSTAIDLSFLVGTNGLQGLTIVFKTWYLADGLPLNEENLKVIQTVTVSFN